MSRLVQVLRYCPVNPASACHCSVYVPTACRVSHVPRPPIDRWIAVLCTIPADLRGAAHYCSATRQACSVHPALSIVALPPLSPLSYTLRLNTACVLALLLPLPTLLSSKLRLLSALQTALTCRNSLPNDLLAGAYAALFCFTTSTCYFCS